MNYKRKSTGVYYRKISDWNPVTKKAFFRNLETDEIIELGRWEVE